MTRIRTAHSDIPQLGISCEAGWLPLVERFLTEAKASLPEGTRLVGVQARQKWALLSLSCRVEPTPQDLKTYAGILAAEARASLESRRTCEVCGQPGRLRRTTERWLMTRCDEHHESLQASHQPDDDEPRAWGSGNVWTDLGLPDPDDDPGDKAD
ncbi:MAG: hypothetical protein KF723_03630 [Rhizobiaceae bacterium]|nr:hypothetical protein [Rhizobiaceae bacterium]